MSRILVAGSVTIDSTVVNGRPAGRTFGGVPTFAGATYAGLGASVTVACNLGGSEGLRARRVLTDLGLEVVSGPADSLTCFVNSLAPGGRRTQVINSLAPPVHRPPDFGAVFDIVHLGPLHGRDLDHDWYEPPRLSELVVVDIQGLVRGIEGKKVVREPQSDLLSALTTSQICKADRHELAAAERGLAMSADRWLTEFELSEIVVTDGPRGGAVLSADGWHAYAATDAHERDSTGAGDVFFASYVIQRASGTASIPEACEVAAQTAAAHVAGGHIDRVRLRID